MADNSKKTKLISDKATGTSITRRPRGERERLNFRIDARIKQRAEDAALLLGQDLSTFAETALDEKAQSVIERQEKLVLSESDFTRFIEAIEKSLRPLTND